MSKVKFGTVKVCFDVSLPEPLQADRAEHALDDGVVEQPASPRGDGMARRRVEGDEAIPTSGVRHASSMMRSVPAPHPAPGSPLRYAD